MQHTFYAVFDSADAARRAVAELERLDTRRAHGTLAAQREGLATGSGTKPPPTEEHLEPMLHRATVVDGEELRAGESALRRGATTGAVAGGVLGAIAGALAGGPLAAGAAVLGGMLGSVYGGVMGGISAAHGPDPDLEKLSAGLHHDQVLLTVAAPGLTLEEEAEDVVTRHGGRVHHRQPV